MADRHPPEVYLERISQDMKLVREMMTVVVSALRDAETEVHEKMRRFVMYMHDIHDIVHMYHEVGQEAPEHLRREMERCDDRLRQLLTEAHSDGGVFEKVRREMADDPLNRWDHTRQLAAPKEQT